jgi:hypothetical protein
MRYSAAAGNYAYIYLRTWVGEMLPWHLADVLISNVYLSLFTLTFFIPLLLGHRIHWARLLNFSSSLRSYCRWMSYRFPTPPACLPLLLDCLRDEKKNERCCGSALLRHPQHLAPQASALLARPWLWWISSYSKESRRSWLAVPWTRGP